MTIGKYLAIGVVAAALGLGILAFRGLPYTERREFGEPTRLYAIADKALNESSGIAPSRATPGAFLTHNDSGDTSRFFKIGSKGTVLATYSLAGAKAIDWEDMAAARIRGTNYVYLGDIGDNASRRTSIVVYRVVEPNGPSTTIDKFDTYELTYPDKPHNCETLMVHPKTGDLWLVTKVDKGPSQVFVLRSPKQSGKYTLKEVGKVEVGTMILGSQMVTAGDISPDGKHVVIRSYTAAFEFAAGDKFDDWVKRKPVRVKTSVEQQGEAVCYSLDGMSLITTSEGTPCPITRIPIRKVRTDPKGLAVPRRIP